VISPSQGRYLHTGQHKRRINAQTDIHALSGIRTHDPSVRANEDSSCLRPRGPCDRQAYSHRVLMYMIKYCTMKAYGAVVSFTPLQIFPVSIGQEAGWILEPVWTLRGKKVYLPLPGIESHSFGPYPSCHTDWTVPFLQVYVHTYTYITYVHICIHTEIGSMFYKHTHILSRVTVTKTREWICNWIY
jgi:hypothetical protein